MRDMVWNLVRRKVPEGMILPWWALTGRNCLPRLTSCAAKSLRCITPEFSGLRGLIA